MKIVVLTSETLHHTYFVQELNKSFPVESVLVEQNIVAAPSGTHHPFEDTREDYEQRAFFQNKHLHLKDVANTCDVSTVNEPTSIALLKKIAPAVMIVFGTGMIYREVIQICPNGIINLHGGDPEEYRGLDTHLWAIYHRDFNGLVTTLHHVNEKLDDGQIILQSAIPVRRGMQLYELRRYNTEICIDMAISALDMFKRWGHTICRPQHKKGRYYSFMPSLLKEICQVRFKEYSDELLS